MSASPEILRRRQLLVVDGPCVSQCFPVSWRSAFALSPSPGGPKASLTSQDSVAAGLGLVAVVKHYLDSSVLLGCTPYQQTNPRRHKPSSPRSPIKTPMQVRIYSGCNRTAANSPAPHRTRFWHFPQVCVGKQTCVRMPSNAVGACLLNVHDQLKESSQRQC